MKKYSFLLLAMLAVASCSSCDSRAQETAPPPPPPKPEIRTNLVRIDFAELPSPTNMDFVVVHDEARRVTCWVAQRTSNIALHCLPDREVDGL